MVEEVPSVKTAEAKGRPGAAVPTKSLSADPSGAKAPPVSELDRSAEALRRPKACSVKGEPPMPFGKLRGKLSCQLR